MDGVIDIRSIKLSNHIAGTRLLRVLWQVITGRQVGVAEIALSHLRKNNGYNDPALVAGFEDDHPQD